MGVTWFVSRPYKNPAELQLPQTRSFPTHLTQDPAPQSPLTGHRTLHWLCPRWSHCKRCPVTVAGSGCAVAGSPVARSPTCQLTSRWPHVAQASKDDPEFLILCLHLLSAGWDYRYVCVTVPELHGTEDQAPGLVHAKSVFLNLWGKAPE